MINYAIKAGFVAGPDSNHNAYGAKLVKGPFFLLKWLKQALTVLGVSWQDTCCIGTSNPPDPNNIPIRFSKTAGNKIQYLDNVTGVWTNLTTF
jgi:hypothetical protein